jgi:Zn-dependent membrane protease YugP
MFDILQIADPVVNGAAAESTNGLMGSFSTGGSLILMIVIGLAGYAVQARLQSVFQRYSKVLSPGGMTGAELAEKMLHDHGIYNVKVTHVKGHLTDHFNPLTMTVNLSDSVYSSRSVAAAAVACHECGHAVQHATGYGPIKMRSRLVPVVSIASQMSTWIVLLGIVIMMSTNDATVAWIGISLVAMSALFSIVTLPVEYNASERALAWLERSGSLNSEEMEGARVSLRWAARTYLVAALSAIATLLYYVMMILSARRE